MISFDKLLGKWGRQSSELDIAIAGDGKSLVKCCSVICSPNAYLHDVKSVLGASLRNFLYQKCKFVACYQARTDNASICGGVAGCGRLTITWNVLWGTPFLFSVFAIGTSTVVHWFLHSGVRHTWPYSRVSRIMGVGLDLEWVQMDDSWMTASATLILWNIIAQLIRRYH